MYDVTRTIAAPPRTVWAILTDAGRLASGGLGIVRLDGAIAPGARLTLWSAADPTRAFALRVTAFDPPRRMAWSGGMPLGLFRGTRTFDLQADGGGTAFRMRETFSGPLSGPITRAMPDLQPSFDAFADGLKRLAEGGSR